MGKCILSSCVVFMCVASHADIIAQYDADTGNPSTAGEVVDPTSVAGGSWTVLDASLGATDAQEGAFEGGQGAWRNLDGTDNNNPGYQIAMTTQDYQDMYDNGFTMTLTLRLEQGGQFLYVGGDNTNTGGGYSFAGDRRIGASFSASGNDYIVTPVGVGGSAVTVTDGILNDTYVRIEIVGDAGAETATWSMFNDDTSAPLSSQNLTAWAGGNTSTDAHTGWQSGSSTGDDREAFYREFTLFAIPEPSSFALLGLAGLVLHLGLRRRRA